MTKTLDNLKQYCIQKQIPIVRDDVTQYMGEYLENKKAKSFLEIGTAFGYSALWFAEKTSLNKIITLEKNATNYEVAQPYLANNNKIKSILTDAFTYCNEELFDVIFIDGPKSHQDVLFMKYQKNLSLGGVIFIDNIYLKKFNEQENLTKNQKNLLKKVKAFEIWLKALTDWKVEILDIGDGLAICTRK